MIMLQVARWKLTGSIQSSAGPQERWAATQSYTGCGGSKPAGGHAADRPGFKVRSIIFKDAV